MRKTKTIQVYEHETIRLKKTKNFEKIHLEALVRFNEREENRDKYFSLAYEGVRFKEYVGVIQAGDLTIEVLPKADRGAGEEEKEEWRDALLDMLKTCRLLQVQHLENASLHLKQNNLLEVYCRLFLDACQRLVHEGLVKKYRTQEGNSFALKGQLLFAKNIQQNVVHAERFYVRSQTYDRHNIFNQLLYTTLTVIPHISSVAANHTKAYQLLADFPEMRPLEVDAETFSSLIYDRKTERYKPALFISQLLLLRYRPDIKSGRQHVLAIMFDMNELWEEYIYRRLKAAEGGHGVTISRQEKIVFWKNRTTGRSKRVKPDIVIRFDDKNRKPIVIDTKWKLPNNLSPSDADLKQLFIYNEYWGCEESYLLYPSAAPDAREGSYYMPFKEEEVKHHCHVLATPVLAESGSGKKGLWKEIGVQLLGAILKHETKNKT